MRQQMANIPPEQRKMVEEMMARQSVKMGPAGAVSGKDQRMFDGYRMLTRVQGPRRTSMRCSSPSEFERKRDEVRRLFELAVDALDAQSMTRTGHTNFGSLTP